MGQGQQIVKAGYLKSDGNAYELDLGFVPDYIKLVNLNAAETEVMIYEWWSHMGDSVALAHIQIDGSTSDAVYSVKKDTSGVITKLDTTTIQTSDPVKKTAKRGVIIATGWLDDNDEIYYYAVGNAPFTDTELS